MAVKLLMLVFPAVMLCGCTAFQKKYCLQRPKDGGSMFFFATLVSTCKSTKHCDTEDQHSTADVHC
jgi:hypothetical protein